jgi:hypothetical protein
MEIVLVDDGCPTPIERFGADLGSSASRILWVRHEENLGLVAALNSGLSKASHPLIARLDADDCWRPGKMAAQLRQFARDPDLTLSATGMTRVTPAGKVVDTHIRPASWDGVLEFFVRGGCPFPHGSVVARKDVYRLLGGYSHDARVSHCEDYALWGVWIRFFKPAMVEQSLYEYTVSVTSVSSVHAEQQERASGVVRDILANSGVGASLPVDLEKLARALGSSLFEAGVAAYLMWKNERLVVDIPRGAIDAMERIMPDRHLARVGGPAQPWHEIVEQVVGCTAQRTNNDPLIAVRAAIA